MSEVCTCRACREIDYLHRLEAEVAQATMVAVRLGCSKSEAFHDRLRRRLLARVDGLLASCERRTRLVETNPRTGDDPNQEEA